MSGVNNPDIKIDEKKSENYIVLKPIGKVTDELIYVKKLFFADEKNNIKLSWEVYIEEIGHQHVWIYTIDANTGQVLSKIDNVVHCKVEPGMYGSSTDHHDDINLRQIVDNNNGNNQLLAPGYRVYPYYLEGPTFGSRQLLTDPANITASPYGWHDTNGTAGAEFTVTRGNNVNAYQDKDANNATDAGSQPDGTSSLTFDFPLDFNYRMDSGTNAKAAVTQLFYMNNMMHDIMYQYGFTEAAGNFQSNNYGRGGAQSDFVFAEAHDGSGLDNANFSTPIDGTRPRMQMYLWNNGTPPTFSITAPAGVAGNYDVGQATFGPCSYNIVNAIPVDALSTGTSPSLFCSTPANAASLAGKVAVIDRGTCEFGNKALRAQNAGAIAVIIVNRQSAGDSLVSMGSGADGVNVTIPCVMVTYAVGQLIRSNMPNTRVTLNASNCLKIDGDLDNGIVSHEYGHGISNRLAGGPSNTSCLGNAEQGGEGWSDFFALVLSHKATDNKNTARGIGTYAISEPPTGAGIRRHPYSYDLSINPITYADMAASPESHDIGEIWCSAIWDMYWNLIDKYGYSNNLISGTSGNNRALKLVMEGLKLQPCSGGFLDYRNAILKADSILYGYADKCEIWSAFARRGMGYSATQGSSYSATDQTAAYNLPPACGATATASFTVSDTVVCVGGSLTLTNTSTATTGTPDSVRWTINGGTPSTSTSNTIVSPIFNTVGTYIISLVAYKSGNVSATVTKSIRVRPNATLALSSATGTNTQTKCVGSAITNITYAVGGGATNANVTGLPSGVSGNYSGGVLTISGTPTASGVFNYTVNTTGTCTQTSLTGTITVNPNGTVALTSATGTNAQTNCEGDAITNITYAVTGSTGASATNLPSGVTGSYSSGVFTISGTPTATGTFNYTVTTSGTSCTPVSVTGTITVNPNGTVALSSAAGTNAQTKCVGAAITNITYAVTGSTSATATGLPAGVTGSYSGGVFTISGTPTATGTFNYTVNTSGSSCTNPTATGTITVNPNGTVALSSAAGTNAQTKCVGTAITNITYAVTGSTSATATGLPAGVTSSYSNGVLTISGTPTATGIFNYTVTTSGSSCTNPTATGTITVTPNATLSLSSASGTNAQSLCVSSPITNITYAVGGGATGASATNLPAGVTGSYSNGVFTISGTPTATGTFNYTVNTTGTCTQTSLTGTITVNSCGCTNAPSASLGSTSGSVCGTTAITVSNNTFGGSATSVSLSESGAGSLNITSASTSPFSFTYTPAAADAGTTVLITLTTNNPNGNPCVAASVTYTLTVQANGTVALSSATGTNAQTKCVGAAITNITYAVTGSTSATASNLPAGVTSSYSNGVLTISGTPTATGTFNYTVTTSGSSCANPTATGTITVTPNATLSLSSAAGTSTQSKCSGTAITNITYAVGGGATGASATNLPAGVTGSYSNGVLTISGTPTAAGTFNYTVNTTGACTQASLSGSIVVNSLPATPVITQNVPSDTIRTSAVGTSYAWYYNGSTTPVATTIVPYYEFATTTGFYTVVVTDASGCQSAQSTQFTPTPGTGIKNSSNSVKVFEVYPNPTEGRLVLNLNLYKTSIVNLSIFTPEGREVYSKSYGNTKAMTDELNINSLSKGVYIIKLNVNDEVHYHKVVKN